jgi:DNA processing protein
MENIIKLDDPRFPNLLKDTGKDAPKQLYYKGNFDEEIFGNCLAVVGSRRMTSYGKQIAEKLVSQIASNNITIVSGFMYGIDATAHKATVNAGGRTIAVMPCGIDLIHPEFQEELYKEILDSSGLIISEYEKDFLPALWTYPRRNRIVAGLSKAILVIEAGEKSGSLITANFAKKYKRKIFVVPCPLTSSLSFGICQLIREGAQVVTCANDILDFFKLRGELKEARPLEIFGEANRGRASMGLFDQQIIAELQKEPLATDDLARCLDISLAELGAKLSIMEIEEKIKKENDKYYVC